MFTNLDDEQRTPLTPYKTLPAHEDILTNPITKQWSVSKYHNEIEKVEVLKTPDGAKVAIYYGPTGNKYRGLEIVGPGILYWASQYPPEMVSVIRTVLPLKPNTIVVQLCYENFCVGDQPHLFSSSLAEQDGHYSHQMLKCGIQHTYLNLKGRARIFAATSLYVEPCLPTASTSSLDKQVATSCHGAGEQGYWWETSAIKTSANGATKVEEAFIKNGE